MTTIDNIMALVDALEEQNYLCGLGENSDCDTARQALRTALTEALAFNPDWADFNNGRECGRIEATEALAAQPVREPLSYEQMRNLSYLPECMNGDYLQVYPFARAIERAHGIGGDK